jgi:hypothetical protein
LRRWWASARSTVTTQTWESRFWVVVGITGVIYDPLSNSIPIIFFMSAWALVKGAKNEVQGAKREMLEEEAEEAEEK